MTLKKKKTVLKKKEQYIFFPHLTKKTKKLYFYFLEIPFLNIQKTKNINKGSQILFPKPKKIFTNKGGFFCEIVGFF